MAEKVFEDRGRRGFVVPKRLTLSGGLDPTKSIYSFEDFIADHLAEDSTVVVNQSGTPTTAAAISAAAGAPKAGHGGWIQGSVDNVDAEIDEVALGAKPWLQPDALAAGEVMVCEVGLVIPSALTARQYFFGFTDDETEGTATNGSLNIQTGVTIVAVADDAAGFIFSSLATDNDAWYTATAKATVVGTAYNTVAGTDGAASGAGVVDDYTKLRVEIDNVGNVWFYSIVSASGQREVTPVYRRNNSAAVTITVPYVPLFAAAPTTTTAVEWELDYIFGGVFN